MEQHYGNHRRLVPGFHYFASGVLLTIIILAIVYMVKHADSPGAILLGFVLLLLAFLVGLTAFYARNFALRAQDRAIRAEENLRHFVLTGKILDSRLRMRQVLALRFAHDEEFILLAAKASEEGWGSTQIKKAIQGWRGDHHRV
jgi:hypothetical protein